MQYGPDLVPISSQSIVIGVPTREPTPIEVTTTETIIAPPTYLTPVIQLNVSNIAPPAPYVIGVSDEGQLVASKVTMLNFVGDGVAATYAGNNNVTVTVTRTIDGLEAGDGIQVAIDNGVATITNTGTINVASGAGISVVKAGNTTTVTNTGVRSVAAGSGISASTNNGVATITNTGITSIVPGTGISSSTVDGAATITNTGVTSIIAGAGISVSAATGNVTVSSTFTETVYNAGNWYGTISPNRNNGSIQKATLVGNLTLNVPINMNAGQSLTLILTQDGVGNRLLDANVSYLFASGFQTLSTSSGAIDMINIFSDGATYYATLTVGYS